MLVGVASLVGARACVRVPGPPAPAAEARPEDASAPSPTPLAVPPPSRRDSAKAANPDTASGTSHATPANAPRDQRPVRTVFVDATTGRPVASARWSDVPPAQGLPWAWRYKAAAGASVQQTDSHPAAVESIGGFAPGSIERAEGYVVQRRDPPRVRIAPRATAFVLIQPLDPELAVELTLVDADDRPDPRAQITEWRVGDAGGGRVRAEPLGGGTWRLRGVPFVAKARFEVWAARLTGDDGKNLDAPEPMPVERERDPPWLALDLPERVPDRIVGRVLVGPWVISDHNETDNDLPFETSLGEGADRGQTLRVEVVDRVGAPIPGVSVSAPSGTKPTDASGVVRFDGLPKGPVSIGAHDAGRVFGAASVEIVAGVEARLTVRELDGVTLDVSVVDADGDAVPFAEIHVREAHQPTEWADVSDDGEQRLDPFTDVLGRRTCARVTPGSVHVTATARGRLAKADVEVRDGERRSLRLELR